MLTVAIVSFNYGHLLAQAIESVLNQTKRPERILVVDDASSDMTGLVSKMYKVDRLWRKKNLGIVDNFNDVLFNHIKTSRVLFLGADNWLAPETVKSVLQRDEDIVSYDSWIVGKGKYKRWNLPYQPHGSAMYNVELAKKVGGYEASGNKHTEEDSVLFRKMMKKGASFYRIKEPLLYYRRHSANFNKH